MNKEKKPSKGSETFSWRKLPLETKYRVGLRSLSGEIGAFRMLIPQLLGAEKGIEALNKFYAGLTHQAYQRAKAKGILKGDDIKDVAAFICTVLDSEGLSIEVEATEERIRIQLNKHSPELCPWGIPKGNPGLCCGIAWTRELVELVNPKLTAYLSKAKRWGDDYCEEVIEWKKE
jgi:hypothetical protein